MILLKVLEKHVGGVPESGRGFQDFAIRNIQRERQVLRLLRDVERAPGQKRGTKDSKTWDTDHIGISDVCDPVASVE